MSGMPNTPQHICCESLTPKVLFLIITTLLLLVEFMGAGIPALVNVCEGVYFMYLFLCVLYYGGTSLRTLGTEEKESIV